MYNQRTASLHRHVLDEINFYRKLLQMSELPRSEAFSEFQSNDQVSHTSTHLSLTPAASATTKLESMPNEILDRIAALMDDKTIWQPSHAIRYYKYISTAMFGVMQLDEKGLRRPSGLWPALKWHNIGIRTPRPRKDGEPISLFPLSHLHAVGTYSRILSKHGGYAEVQTWEGMETVVGALPEMLELTDGFMD
ncbi:hypothetical protein BJ741DRAFT_635166 [Chytriomyces cf. hyalinus JEL632]|nr:hypothetical protein BJ741DRAFT_635166 [Chytriomyces cf. hyalinus JEL632]